MTGGHIDNDPQAIDRILWAMAMNIRKLSEILPKQPVKFLYPPAYVFGYWYSRYYSYSADDYRGDYARN